MCIRFFKLYCHPTVYGRQRNGLKDCRTLRIVRRRDTSREYYIIIRTQDVLVAKNRNNGLPPR